MVYCVYSAPILFDVDRVCDCIQRGWFGSLKTCFLPRVVIERRTSGKCYCERYSSYVVLNNKLCV